MEMNIFVYLSFAVILALLSSKLIKLIKFPNVTGYLIAGLLAGPYILNLIPTIAVEQLSFIPEIALGFIAFSIGSEFKVTYLKKVGKSPVIIAVCEALLAVVIVDAVLIMTGHDVVFSLLLGAIAAATAPAATLMVVRQFKAKGPVTDTLLPVVAIDDAVALMVFGISVAAVKAITSVEQVSLLSTLITPIIEIIGALLFGAILGILLKFVTKWFTGRGNRLSASIAFVFFCIGMSKMFGLSELLACMAMSAVFVNISNVSDIIFEQVDRFTPPIFMLFFFLSGAELNIAILPSVGVVGLIYVVFRAVGKILGAALGARLSNAPEVVKNYLGFTLIPQAGVAIGLAGVATTISPEFGETIKVIILSATVIYELVGPIATKLALMKAGEIDTTDQRKLKTASVTY